MKDVIKLKFSRTERESECPLKYLCFANISASDLIDS